MLSYKRLCPFVFGLHVFKFCETLLEFLTSRRVLGHGSHQLDIVESGLFVKVVEKFNNDVKFIEIVNLNFTSFQLGKGCESSSSRATNIRDAVTEHFAKGLNAICFNGLAFAVYVVGDTA